MRTVFNFIQLLVGSRCDLLEEYSKEVEWYIDEKKKAYIEDTDMITKGFSKEHIEEFWDLNYDDYHQLKASYPSVLRYSIILSLYTTVEQTLIRIHYPHSKNRKAYKKHKSYKIIVDGKKEKRQRSNIDAVIEYLKQDMHLHFPKHFPELEYINSLNRIRNNIAHNNGRIYDDDSPETLMYIIKSLTHISESSSREILIEKEFIEIMFNNIRIFFDVIFNALEQQKHSS